MNKPKLIMLVGLPGSGKSYQAEQIAEQYGAKVHSSDQLRQELLGDINDQTNNDLVFTTLRARIKDDLRHGVNCVYDACNIKRKARLAELKCFSGVTCEKICVFIATPYDQCLVNNRERNRTIPENVIRRMYTNFDPPYYYEGWDQIQVVYWPGSKDGLSILDFLGRTQNFSQDNKNHQLSLGEHCLGAAIHALHHYGNAGHQMNKDVIFAAVLHDEGKYFTKEFKNARGETTIDAHYFAHHNVGSYNSFFYQFNGDHLYVAQLINWHMRPYMAWDVSASSQEKDRALIGESMFYDLMVVHEADLAAH